MLRQGNVFLLCVSILSTPLLAQAMPAEVLILRHAEKPADDSIPSLSPAGYARAAALPGLFQSDRRFDGPIAAIFAASPKKAGKSVRSEETMAPLAQSLGLSVQDADQYGGMKELAEHLQDDRSLDGTRVVVCLAHGDIAKLAQDLGAEDAPKKWDKGAFDRIWEISYSDSDVRFQDLPQRLMKGDDNQ